MTQSEIIIINLARLGNDNAFRQLVNQYKDTAYTLARTYIRNSTIAEDVVQEAFVNAYFNLHKFKGKSKFSTWLYRIVINEAFKQRKILSRYTDLAIANQEVMFASENPQILLEKRDQSFYIQEALEAIKPKEALALRLFYLEDLKITDIAKVTGWSKSNIKVLIHRGRTHLKMILEAYVKNELISIEK